MKKVLFIIGSTNQTMQMHKIASCLPEFDCYFSQYYSDNLILKTAIRAGLADHTILSGRFRSTSERYLKTHRLKNDYALSHFHNVYDLVFTCSDLIVPKSIRSNKIIWVQEGMTDPVTHWSRIVNTFRLPRYLAIGTSLNGTSNRCDIYCVASQGYREHFSALGTSLDKMIVTGMPNFDDVESFRENDFPYKDFVLVATSDIRECYGFDDRPAFIRKAAHIANGRKLVFKLHPNERVDRALREIEEYAPAGTQVLAEGNVNHMIANCEELITQYSTVAYVGLVLGKKTHSYFRLEDLRKKLPIQNGGTSASYIAEVGRRYVNYPRSKKHFLENELQQITTEPRKSIDSAA